MFENIKMFQISHMHVTEEDTCTRAENDFATQPRKSTLKTHFNELVHVKYSSKHFKRDL